MGKAEAHYKKMTQTPVNKLIISLAVPTVISMLISNIYNLADTYFVGSLGVSQSGAVGIVFTLMAVLQAIGFMFGHGSGSVISRLLARKDTDTASSYASTALFMTIIFGSLFILLGIPLIRPFMRILGSTETILPYAMQYGYFILASAPLLMGSLVLNNILRYEGNAFFGMIGLSLGGILNMIGDPICIRLMGLGVVGAGLSTAVSQLISFIVLVILFRRHAQSRLSIRLFKPGIITDICTTGFPNLFRQGLSSIASGLLNNYAGIYGGDACVSAMSITSRCQFFMLSIALGISQGFQPVSGFNFQARKYRRLRDAFRFTLFGSFVVLALLCSAGFILSPKLVRLFQGNAKVVEIGTVALRFASISLFITPLNLVPSMLFQSTGHKSRALLLAALRGGLCFIPMILILPPILGMLGIELAQPIADVLTSVLSCPFAYAFLHSLPKADERTEFDERAVS